VRHLEKGRVVILPAAPATLFSTDTAAVASAVEIKADVIMKATQVDGIYSATQERQNARRFKSLSFAEVFSRRLKVMDTTGLHPLEENGLPSSSSTCTKKGQYPPGGAGEEIGTYVHA